MKAGGEALRAMGKGPGGKLSLAQKYGKNDFDDAACRNILLKTQELVVKW